MHLVIKVLQLLSFEHQIYLTHLPIAHVCCNSETAKWLMVETWSYKLSMTFHVAEAGPTQE